MPTKEPPFVAQTERSGARRGGFTVAKGSHGPDQVGSKFALSSLRLKGVT
jgi:hypothetical protein